MVGKTVRDRIGETFRDGVIERVQTDMFGVETVVVKWKKTGEISLLALENLRKASKRESSKIIDFFVDH